MSGPGPVHDARAALSALAQALYEAENGPDLVFVRAQAEAGGPGSPAAGAIVDELASLWEQYPVLTQVVERLETAAADQDTLEMRRLLGPDGVVLPDGTTTGLGPCLSGLRRRAEEVATESARLAGAARQAISRLDSVSRAVVDLLARAAKMGAGTDPEVVAAGAALDAAQAAVALDPSGTASLAALDRTVDVARRRVEQVEAQRRDLPGALAGAEAQLEEVRRLLREGAEGLGRARDRIASPDGLLEPLDPAGLDGDERALGPWLDRIRRQAGAGGWRVASEGLEGWRKVADAWLANARRVAAANTAPVRRRNELRGLLDAYRAKAVARGGAEDEALATLYETAYHSLHVAPCELAAAEAAVRHYVDAVNSSSRTAQ